MLILSGNSPGALGIFPGLNGLGRVPSSLGIDYAVPSTLVIPLASDCTVKTISVWLNAFIPGNAPGFTKPVPGGVHAGKTMLDTGDGNCFLSNGRDFSSDPNAESMLQSRVDVEIARRRGPYASPPRFTVGDASSRSPRTLERSCAIALPARSSHNQIA